MSLPFSVSGEPPACAGCLTSGDSPVQHYRIGEAYENDEASHTSAAEPARVVARFARDESDLGANGRHQITDRSDLPSALQKLAIKAVKDEGTWRAWLAHDGVRFFVSEMSLELSRERGCAALKVHYYDEQGQLQTYSQWVQLADGATWQRCTV